MATKKTYSPIYSDRLYDKDGHAVLIGSPGMTGDELIEYHINLRKEREKAKRQKSTIGKFKQKCLNNICYTIWYVSTRFPQWYRRRVTNVLIFVRKVLTWRVKVLERKAYRVDVLRSKTYLSGWKWMTKEQKMAQLWRFHTEMMGYGTDWLLNQIIEEGLEKEYYKRELYT